MRWMVMCILVWTMLVVSQAFATQYYVDGTLGTDDGAHGTGTGADAWKNIEYAIGAAAAGISTITVASGTYTESGGNSQFDIGSGCNGKFLSINSATGNPDDVVITAESTNFPMTTGAAWTSGSCTFNNVTITGGAAYATIYSSSPMPVTLNNVKVANTTEDGGAGAAGITIAAGSPTWTITGGSITTVSSPLKLMACTSMSVTGTTLTWTQNTYGVRLLAGCLAVKLDTCTFAGPDAQYGAIFDKQGALAAYCAVKVVNCSGTVGRVTADISAEANGSYIGPCVFQNNTLTLTYNDGLFLVGYDGLGAGCQFGGTIIAPWRDVIIADNTFTCTDASATHLFFSGVGGKNLMIVGNTWSAPNSTTAYGLVIKSDNNLIYNNVVKGPGGPALYISGGSHNYVINNTFVSNTNNAGEVDINLEWNDDANGCSPEGSYGAPRNNVFINNIIQGGGTWAVSYDPTGNNNAGATATGNTANWNNYFDHNLYWADGTLDCLIFGHNTATMRDANYGWASGTFAGLTAVSDVHSVYADPLLLSPSTGDFRIPYTSPALNAGYPGSAGAGYRNIGAFQHRAKNPTRVTP